MTNPTNPTNPTEKEFEKELEKEQEAQQKEKVSVTLTLKELEIAKEITYTMLMSLMRVKGVRGVPEKAHFEYGNRLVALHAKLLLAESDAKRKILNDMWSDKKNEGG